MHLTSLIECTLIITIGHNCIIYSNTIWLYYWVMFLRKPHWCINHYGAIYFHLGTHSYFTLQGTLVMLNTLRKVEDPEYHVRIYNPDSSYWHRNYLPKSCHVIKWIIHIVLIIRNLILFHVISFNNHSDSGRSGAARELQISVKHIYYTVSKHYDISAKI